MLGARTSLAQSGVVDMTDPVPLGMYNTGQQPNALQTMGQMQQLQLGNVQLQQAQQQMAAKQAMGPILQQSINPQTGELDYNKAFIGLSSNPATAFLAGDFLSQGIQRKQTQAETALKELELKKNQQGQIFDALKGLSAKGNTVTTEDAVEALTDRLNSGVIDRKQYQAALDTVKKYPAGAPLAGFVKQTMLGTMAAKDALEMVHGSIKTQDLGHAVVLYQHDQANNVVRNLGVFPKSMTPEQMAAQVSGAPAPDGSPTSESMAQRLQRQGMGGLTGQNPIPQTFGGGDPTTVGAPAEAPPLAGAGGGLQTPSALQPGQGVGGPSGAPAGASAGAPPPASPQPVVTGLSPMKEGLQKDNAKYVDGVAGDMEKVGQAMQTLNHMDGLLDKFKAGPGASTRQEAAQFLESIGVPKADVDKLVGAKDGVAAMQVFQNEALKYATQQLKQAIEGSRITNMEFKAVVDTKPNVNMRPEAIKAIIERARIGFKIAQEQTSYMQQWMEAGKDITNFRTQFMPKFHEITNSKLQHHYAAKGQL